MRNFLLELLQFSSLSVRARYPLLLACVLMNREIAGEGVIGLYPVLSLSPTGGSHIGSASTVEDDAAHGYGVALGSFRYESAVELGNLPGMSLVQGAETKAFSRRG